MEAKEIFEKTFFKKWFKKETYKLDDADDTTMCDYIYINQWYEANDESFVECFILSFSTYQSKYELRLDSTKYPATILEYSLVEGEELEVLEQLAMPKIARLLLEKSL